MPRKTPDIHELLNDPDLMLRMAEDPEGLRAEMDALYWDIVGRKPAKARPAARPEQAASDFSIVGQRIARIEGEVKVTGLARYSSDVSLPGMLHARFLRSPHAHARIVAIDTSKAEALPGVFAVLTYKDVSANKYKFSSPPDRFILGQEVYYVGDEVAAVAATDEHTAEEAVDLIKVDYEVLPAVFDPVESLDKDAPKIVNDKGNLFVDPVESKRGDIEKGFREAEVTVEDTIRSQTEQHATLEPRTCVAAWDGDRVTVWDSTQYTHGARSGLASALGIPLSKVRVVSEFMGGGFGDKTGADRHHVLAALLAKKTGRPVRVFLTRPENFAAASHRYATVAEIKVGAKKDGTLVAYQCKMIANGGAHRYTGANGALTPIKNLYRCPNAYFQAYDVFTNLPRSGAQRCVGDPQGTFAQEVVIDRLADSVGMDPLEFRLKNLNMTGDQDSKLPFASCGIRECLDKAAEAIDWKKKWHKPGTVVEGTRAHGIGLAAHMCTHGAMSPPMSGIVKVNRDGSVDVITGIQDIGGGQTTAMCMIAGEELGVRWQDVSATIGNADTAASADSGGTYGSRATISGGSGIKIAAEDARRQLFAVAVAPRGNNPPFLKAKVDDLAAKDGFIFVRTDPSQRVEMAKVAAAAPGPIIGRGFHVRPAGYAMAVFAAGFVELEVDTETGHVELLNYVVACDVGRAINPLAVEQQIQGATAMGFGRGLSEDLLVDPNFGWPVNANYLDYKVLTTLDIAKKMKAIIVETIDPNGPFGAKGVGEPPTCPPAPAIANAIYNAVGLRFNRSPISRAMILEGLRQKSQA